ncbi:hypothetical protein, partial [Allokutzneria sp. NRRL B-24872]|uniref:hypothetical protein n=1 Tax=Allokutzneria sp. NRRL B-24872 TaxID=1137961 RepID=UPI001AF02902
QDRRLGAVFTGHGGSGATAVADGAGAVLTVSAALSALAVLSTLVLINPRRVPSPPNIGGSNTARVKAEKTLAKYPRRRCDSANGPSGVWVG